MTQTDVETLTIPAIVPDLPEDRVLILPSVAQGRTGAGLHLPQVSVAPTGFGKVMGSRPGDGTCLFAAYIEQTAVPWNELAEDGTYTGRVLHVVHREDVLLTWRVPADKEPAFLSPPPADSARP